MICDLIIDGNYILSRLVFTLHKNNLLYGALHKSLENAINNYRKWYPFANVFLVSDSKEKSWRKQLTKAYKANRKKNSDIDWAFVYNAYDEFKQSMSHLVTIFEAPHIEGDDWISFLSTKANSEGRSTIIVSNDYDIKQIVNWSLNPLYINIMTNEMYNKEKLFMPKNYQIFISNVTNLPNNDISSVWSQIKNGKKRGIGAKGAKSIYDTYLVEFGEISLEDPDLYENIADLICEKKKLSKTQIESIVENINFNVKLIDLRLQNLPDEIIEKMKSKYDTFSDNR